MIKNSRSENGKAYYELVTGFQSSLYAFISVLLGGSDDAADVLQETNVALWDKASQYDPESDFRAWAYAIARYQVLAYFKRRTRDNRLVFSQDLVEVIATDFRKKPAAIGDRINALQGCLKRLPGPQRDLINLRYEQGQKVAAIAGRLNQSANAVSVMLHRIRKSLLDCVERAIRSESYE